MEDSGGLQRLFLHKVGVLHPFPPAIFGPWPARSVSFPCPQLLKPPQGSARCMQVPPECPSAFMEIVLPGPDGICKYLHFVRKYPV